MGTAITQNREQCSKSMLSNHIKIIRNASWVICVIISKNDSAIYRGRGPSWIPKKHLQIIRRAEKAWESEPTTDICDHQ